MLLRGGLTVQHNGKNCLAAHCSVTARSYTQQGFWRFRGRARRLKSKTQQPPPDCPPLSSLIAPVCFDRSTHLLGRVSLCCRGRTRSVMPRTRPQRRLPGI